VPLGAGIATVVMHVPNPNLGPLRMVATKTAG
jgi:hypothetical protein